MNWSRITTINQLSNLVMLHFADSQKVPFMVTPIYDLSNHMCMLELVVHNLTSSQLLLQLTPWKLNIMPASQAATIHL